MSSPVQLFQYARTILCVCPCCGDIVRVSDLTLHYEGETPRTWLDEYKDRWERYEKRRDAFERKESVIRQKSRETGRRSAARTIRKVVKQTFPGVSYHPKDIKAVLHPVDCVVGSGMATRDKISKIVLLSKETDWKELRKIRRSIRRTVERESYDWQVVRVSPEGELEIEGD